MFTKQVQMNSVTANLGHFVLFSQLCLYANYACLTIGFGLNYPLQLLNNLLPLI